MHNLSENTLFHQRYQLQHLLGSGAFSEVWKARDQRTGTTFALKVFAPDKGIDQDGIEGFAEEYRNTNELMHPNILRANHFDVCDNSPYLVLPYCKGRSLSAWLAQKHPFSEKDIAEIMAQISSALAYIHQSKDDDGNIIVHKDIKPANILIKDERLGTYLLADFGISTRMKQTVARSVLNSSLDINSYNSFTPAYAPPEVSRSLPSPAGDVFSLGLTLLELIYGKPLPYTQPLGQILEQTGNFPELPPISDRFSDALCNLILTCLDIDKRKRPLAATLSEKANYYLKNGRWKDQYPATENISRTPIDHVLENLNDEEDTIAMPKLNLPIVASNDDDTQAVPNKKSSREPDFDAIPISKLDIIEPIKHEFNDEKPIPPPPSHKRTTMPIVEENIPKHEKNKKSERITLPTTPDTVEPTRKFPKGIIAAVVALGLGISAWFGGIIPTGNHAVADKINLWQSDEIVKDLPETYRQHLHVFYNKLNVNDKNFRMYGSNDWTLVDFQMGTGSQKSLACILRDQKASPAKAKLLIWHPDSEGKLGLDTKISPFACHECKGVIAQESIVPTVCAVDATTATTAKPVPMSYAYLKTDEPNPRIIYRNKDGVLVHCYGSK